MKEGSGKYVPPLPITKKFKSLVDENGRVCTVCDVYRPWIDFKGHTRSKTGRSAQCKACYKSGRRSKGRKKELASKIDRRMYLKVHEPYVWKSRGIRSSLLGRATSTTMKAETPTAIEIQSWLEAQPMLCYYSGEPLSIYDINIDHKTPITRGGTNQLDNLCIASHHMNTVKGAMNEQEFSSLISLVSTWEDKGDKLFKRLKQGHF